MWPSCPAPILSSSQSAREPFPLLSPWSSDSEDGGVSGSRARSWDQHQRPRQAPLATVIGLWVHITQGVKAEQVLDWSECFWDMVFSTEFDLGRLWAGAFMHCCMGPGSEGHAVDSRAQRCNETESADTVWSLKLARPKAASTLDTLATGFPQPNYLFSFHFLRLSWIFTHL